MTGGKGNDTFEFQRSDEDQQTITCARSPTSPVGDRIVAATYEISYSQDEESSKRQICDMFDDIYLSPERRPPPGALPFRGSRQRRVDIRRCSRPARHRMSSTPSNLPDIIDLQFTVAVA